MTATLLPLLAGLPLAAAGITAPARAGAGWARAVLLGLLSANLAAGITLVVVTAGGDVFAEQVGGWPGGISIPFVADTLAALMLTVTGLLALVCTVFGLMTGPGGARLFPPLVMALVGGVNGALLTADIFNLFVFIEVMLLPSYGLLVLARTGQGTLRSVTGTRLYIAYNLFASTLFLAGVALVYGTAGTVNLAQLAGAAQESTTVAVAAGICLAALGMKAAVVPVHGWLARAYPSTSPAVTALFSGLHTKVAIYAIYRIYAVVFDGDSRWLWIGVLVFSATMLIGVLGAVGENTMRAILAFHMVSQIGYILLGVALFTPLGLAAGIFYLLHHMIVKASLFLSTGAVEERHGTGALDKIRGVAHRDPLLVAAFGVAALSLAGIPPFSGFVAKLTLVLAALDAGQIAAAIVALVVGLLTLLSMIKIWDSLVRRPDEPDAEPATTGGSTAVAAPVVPKVGLRLTLPALVLAAVTLGLGIGAELLYALSTTAAAGLLDTSTYVEAVLTP